MHNTLEKEGFPKDFFVYVEQNHAQGLLFLMCVRRTTDATCHTNMQSAMAQSEQALPILLNGKLCLYVIISPRR